MLSFQLFELSKILNPQQIDKVREYLNKFTNTSKITISKFILGTQLDSKLALQTINTLADLNILTYTPTIRCSQCGLLLYLVNDIRDIDREIYCYGCEQHVEINSDDVELVYTPLSQTR